MQRRRMLTLAGATVLLTGSARAAPSSDADAASGVRSALERGAVAAVATYAGRHRNPVLLDRSVWADVAALAEGDAGARSWLRAHPDLVTAVPCDDTGSARDVDTPADLAALPRPAITPDHRRVQPA